MRVISGTLKGRSIDFIKNSKTRPLRDSVRESIFNILKHSNLTKVKIENSNILDLYSGVGSFGIECLSRGAKKVTFIEQDPLASKILKENLIKLSIINRSKIQNSKIESVLEKYKEEKFEIFFLDPPYADTKFVHVIKLLKNNKIYKKNHSVIIHRERGNSDDFENFLRVIKTKFYGRSKILFGEFI